MYLISDAVMSEEDLVLKLVVGICDDEQYVHDIIDKVINLYSDSRGIEIEVVHFFSAEQLLIREAPLDFLFLDIDMPEMDGIEAGYKLRKRNIDYKIIMLTGREDRFKEAFKIEAYRFMTKPVNQDEVFDIIDVIRENKSLMKTVLVYRDGIKYDIAQKEILYIEANRSSTLIFTGKAEYRSERSLTKWITILDENIFFQCHKSFIVNMGKVEELHDTYIRMINSDRVAISRRLKKAFMHAYMKYDTKWR